MKGFMQRGALLSGILMWASVGSATITQVSSPAELTGGAFTVETFENKNSVFQPGATYSAPNGVAREPASGATGGVTPSGGYGLMPLNLGEDILITFALPVSSVGLWFGSDDACCSTGFVASLDIYGASGLLGTISVPANMNDFCDQFLGFNSDQQVTSVQLRYTPGSGLKEYIDDVYFSTVEGCPPFAQSGCRTAGRSFLLVKNKRQAAKNRLTWKWSNGAPTFQQEFSDPTSSTNYALCLYAGTTSALIGQSFVPGGAPKWSPLTTKGYRYDDRFTVSGISKVLLIGSGLHKSKIMVRGRGAGLPTLPPGSVKDSVLVQVMNGDTHLCWGAHYTGPGIVKNGNGELEAKAP